MTAGLLASTAARRKVVVDTCAVFEGEQWHDTYRPRAEAWMGEDGVVVLPGRVVAEMARVAARLMLQGSDDAIVAAQRAALALLDPGRMLGVPDARRAVLSSTDVGELCRDSADLNVIEPGREGKCVPGDGDFEIAHTVRVLTAAAHEAALVTRDRDLRKAASRLGVDILGRPALPVRTGVPPRALRPVPDAVAGRTVNLLGLEAATTLLKGRLPVPGRSSDILVVLSSTLVRAAQRAALGVPRAPGGEPDAGELAKVQDRLNRLLTTGDLGGTQRPVFVWATPWAVYHEAAQRVSDPRFALDESGTGPLDMHTLLVLAAAEALTGDGHEVRLVSSGRDPQRDHLLAAMRSWRLAGGLKKLTAAGHHRFGQRELSDVPLPSDGMDLGALLDKYRRR